MSNLKLLHYPCYLPQLDLAAQEPVNPALPNAYYGSNIISYAFYHSNRLILPSPHLKWSLPCCEERTWKMVAERRLCGKR